jgi:hypothetical protein
MVLWATRGGGHEFLVAQEVSHEASSSWASAFPPLFGFSRGSYSGLRIVAEANAGFRLSGGCYLSQQQHDRRSAENFPDGEVQFTAGGVYNTAPKYVSPLKTYGWGACQAGVSTNDVVISQTGLAHCAAGASGVYSVYTSVATACNAVGPCGTGCLISGYAQLTCP